MKTLGNFRPLTTLLFALLCALVSLTALAADDSSGDVPEKSLLRVAEVPAKPNAKKFDLRYKLQRGDVLRYEVTHRASIHTTIEKSTQEAQTQTDSIKAWKVTDVLPEGDIEFTNVVEKVHMKNQLPDKDPTEYDSTKDKIAPPGFEDAAKAIGVPLSVMRITPQGKVVRRDLKVRNQGADDDAPIVLRLPEKSVAIGDTWDESFEVQVALEKSGTKMIQTRRHYKLSDVKNGIASIAVTYQVLSPIDPHIETQIVQRLMEGEARFDIEKGYVVGQRMDIDKRIIGFAGPTSSMQYVTKMEESLVKNDSTIASESDNKTAAGKNKPSSTSTKSATQTASKPKSTSSTGKSYRK